MSFLAALPARDGIVLCSDSRATIGTDQTIVDHVPKIIVLGDFALGTSGRARDVSHDASIDFDHEALAFWQSESFRVNEESFERFVDAMLVLVRRINPTPDDNTTGTGWLVAQAISDDEMMIGDVMIAFAGTNGPHVRLAELWRPAPTTALRMIWLSAGGAEVNDAVASVPRPVLTAKGRSGLDVADGAAYLVDVLRAAANAEPLIGGASSITVLRPSAYARHDPPPSSQARAANLKQVTNMVLETQASAQSAATEGRTYYNTTLDQIEVDDGSAIRRVPTIASVTRGGIVKGSATANMFNQLAIGAANTVLVSDGTDPSYSGTPTIATEDSRTNSVTRNVTVQATTSGTPAAGIGIGQLFKGESGDENPSDFGALDFVATDVGAGTEDTAARISLRTAGAALGERWGLAATGAFLGTFTHANTAARAYTLPDSDTTLTGAESGTWATAARSIDTIYQNTSGKKRRVLGVVAVECDAASEYAIQIGSQTPPTDVQLNPVGNAIAIAGAGNVRYPVSFEVPNNWYWRIATATGTVSLADFYEMDE